MRTTANAALPHVLVIRIGKALHCRVAAVTAGGRAPALAGFSRSEVNPGDGVHPADLGYHPAPIMDNGRGASPWVRAGLLAGIVIPLVLLAGFPASAWHGEHPGERECAVCHSGHETADLSRPAEPVAYRAGGPTEPEAEVPRVPSRRSLRRPARAPPA